MAAKAGKSRKALLNIAMFAGRAYLELGSAARFLPRKKRENERR
jgi:hypothetical protein